MHFAILYSDAERTAKMSAYLQDERFRRYAYPMSPAVTTVPLRMTRSYFRLVPELEAMVVVEHSKADPAELDNASSASHPIEPTAHP